MKGGPANVANLLLGSHERNVSIGGGYLETHKNTGCLKSSLKKFFEKKNYYFCFR